MSNYKRCGICGKFGPADSHQCPPVFRARVKVDQTFYVIEKVYADNRDEAAVKATAKVDSFFDHSYPIASKAWTVEVQVVDNKGVTSWHNIDGALEPTYCKSMMSSTIGRDTIERVWVEGFNNVDVYQLGDLLLVRVGDRPEAECEALDKYMVGQTRPTVKDADVQDFIYLHDYDRFRKIQEGGQFHDQDWD